MSSRSVAKFIAVSGFDKIISQERLDVNLFELALTHSSYSNEKSRFSLENNERLEFYGDAVLKLACSKFLFNKFPDEREGTLSAYRAILVSDAYLVKYSAKISLDKYLRVADRADLKTKKAAETICACAFEAVLGALFIQSDFEVVYSFLEQFFIKHIEYVRGNMIKLNSKAALQEYTQSVDKNLPEYILLSESGKEHEKVFEVEVRYNKEVVGKGFGNSKKAAEQAAAYEACVKFGVIKNE